MAPVGCSHATSGVQPQVGCSQAQRHKWGVGVRPSSTYLGRSSSGFWVAVFGNVGEEGGYFRAFASLRQLLRRQSCYVWRLRLSLR